MSLIGYTFIISSGDESEDSELYKFERVKFYKKLRNVFDGITKQLYDMGEENNVTYTVNIAQFIRDYTNCDFGCQKVGFIGKEHEERDIIVKCIYGED